MLRVLTLILLLILPYVVSAQGQIRDDASILYASVWDRPDGIGVCWEDLAESIPKHRDIVRSSVANTWEKQSRVRFVGWGKCDGSHDGIRIRVRDEGPHVKALGSRLRRVIDGMVLNFTFRNWQCSRSIEDCIRIIAVHEFGHALGFAHGQNRTDAPSWCRESKQGTSGDIYLSVFDMKSVMNYCNPNWAGNGMLSSLDVVGLQRLYGTSVPTTGDLCFRHERQSPTSGLYSTPWKCIDPGKYVQFNIGDDTGWRDSFLDIRASDDAEFCIEHSREGSEGKFSQNLCANSGKTIRVSLGDDTGWTDQVLRFRSNVRLCAHFQRVSNVGYPNPTDPLRWLSQADICSDEGLWTSMISLGDDTGWRDQILTFQR